MAGFLQVILLVMCGIILPGCGTSRMHAPIEFVNPFIGTNSTGNTFPGATVPFGMVQLSPDNGAIGSKNYYYDNDTIIGFSHTHLSGTGTGTSAKYANIMFMPTTGLLKFTPGIEQDSESRFGSSYSHEQEEAHPGYYKVLLKDYGITAELTATKRTGIHRYQFPESDQSHIIIDITRYPTHGKQDEAYIEVLGNDRISGYTTVREREGDIPFRWYFYAEFSKPFDSFGTINKGVPSEGSRLEKGMEGIGAYLNYQTNNDEIITIKTGISFTSIEGAKRNLEAEAEGKDFDLLRASAEADWNKELSKVKVEGSTRINKIKFYTSLYHTLLFPRTFSDADQSYYSHFTDSIYSDPGFTYYVDFSLWDTYRAVHPLFTILEPQRQNEMIKTLLAMYEQGGRIPLQTSYRNFYSEAMIGDHGSTMILDSYLKGLRDYDVEKAYEGMRKNAFEIGSEAKDSREGLQTYDELGYAAADRVRESVSVTMEDAFVDWGLAQVAKDLKRTEDYQILMKRSQNYRNLYDPETGFFRPKLSDGRWVPECDRRQKPEIVTDQYNHYYDCWDKWWIGVSPNRHYSESNAHQYLWYVPHDVPGLIELMGGKDRFVNRIDEFFNASSSNSGPYYVGVTGAIGQYVHGNEPSHHVAYLYDYAGSPWKTQDRVREIMETKYTIDSRGLSGNDDMGQMSAWFVFSALGFYPVTPGSSIYQIGSPLFERAVIDLGPYYAKRTFIITAQDNSGDNKFIQSVTLNGEVLDRPWVTHSEITGGGQLVFKMGPEPNKKWGINKRVIRTEPEK